VHKALQYLLAEWVGFSSQLSKGTLYLFPKNIQQQAAHIFRVRFKSQQAAHIFRVRFKSHQ